MKFIENFLTRKSQITGHTHNTVQLFDLDGQPSFDLRDLFLLTEDNTEYTIQLLELFFDNAEKGLKQLQLVCEQKNWEQASAVAHKLIPGCKQLYISQLVRILEEIEIQTKDNPEPLSLIKLSNQALYSFYQVKKMIDEEFGNFTSNRIPVE